MRRASFPITPTIGVDPELFIVSSDARKRSAIPAERLITTRSYHRRNARGVIEYNPIETNPWIHTHVVKLDNGAVELNPQPKHCLQELNGGINYALKAADSHVQRVFKGKAKLAAVPVVQFTQADIAKYASLSVFGCDPASLYSEGELHETQTLIDPFTETRRTAGYHIHLGAPKDRYSSFGEHNARYTVAERVLKTPEEHIKLVQTCDLFVGLVGVLFDDSEDTKWRRLTMGYGRAGEFRAQPHGFEYRVLSNFPLRHPTLAWIMNCLARDAYYAVAMGLEFYKHINMHDVEYAINFCDRDAAAILWLDLKRLFAKQYFKRTQSYAPSCIMFSKDSIKDLERILSHRPLKTNFTGISLNTWSQGMNAAGVNRYASGIGSNKTTKDYFFDNTWKYEEDNLLRFMR